MMATRSKISQRLQNCHLKTGSSAAKFDHGGQAQFQRERISERIADFAQVQLEAPLFTIKKGPLNTGARDTHRATSDGDQPTRRAKLRASIPPMK